MGYTPFKMKYKNLEEVVEQLQGAVKAHGKQAKVIEEHIDEMESPAKAKAKGIDGKACWKGYRREGTKMKGGKRVDNCVKVGDEEIPAEDAEKVDKDRMKCNSPRRTSGGSKKFVVKACKDGKEKIVRFGDPNMRIKKSNPKRRKSFRARHKCDQKKDKFSAGYWSCKKW